MMLSAHCCMTTIHVLYVGSSAIVMLLTGCCGMGITEAPSKPISIAKGWDSLSSQVQQLKRLLCSSLRAASVAEWGRQEIKRVRDTTRIEDHTVVPLYLGTLPPVIAGLGLGKPSWAAVHVHHDSSLDYLTVAWGGGRGMLGIEVRDVVDSASPRQQKARESHQRVIVWSIPGE